MPKSKESNQKGMTNRERADIMQEKAEKREPKMSIAEIIILIVKKLWTIPLIKWITIAGIIIGIICLCGFLINAIKYSLQKKNKSKYYKRSDYWLDNAQARQNKKYEYSDPQFKKEKQGNKWAWNEKSRMWVHSEQMEKEKNEQAYQAVKKKWDDLKKEQQMLEELRKPIYLTEEEKELAKQIRIERKGPTYEEWKEQQKKNEQNPRE